MVRTQSEEVVRTEFGEDWTRALSHAVSTSGGRWVVASETTIVTCRWVGWGGEVLNEGQALQEVRVEGTAPNTRLRENQVGVMEQR